MSRYNGEIIPRRYSWAVLLTVLMPGLGHVYVGSPRRGFVIYASYFSCVLATVVYAIWMDTFLLKPLLAVGFLYLVMSLGLIFDLFELIAAQGGRYVHQPYNHPMVYMGTFLSLCVLPLVSICFFVFSSVLGVLTVSDDGMYPKLLVGDRIYYVRDSGMGSGIEDGDLAVVAIPQVGSAVLRSLATSGDSAHQDKDGNLVVNETPLQREPLGIVEILDGESRNGSQMRLVGYLERSGNRVYEVYYDRLTVLTDLEPVRVPQGARYLVADHRTMDPMIDSRTGGPIPNEWIVGHPLFVWHSESPRTGAVRWSRIGLAVE